MSDLRPTDERLEEMAARLRLTYTRDHLTQLIETATKSQMTPRETLEFIFGREIEKRNINRIKLAEMSAHFPFNATIDSFDFNFQPSLNMGIIRELCESVKYIV